MMALYHRTTNLCQLCIVDPAGLNANKGISWPPLNQGYLKANPRLDTSWLRSCRRLSYALQRMSMWHCEHPSRTSLCDAAASIPIISPFWVSFLSFTKIFTFSAFIYLLEYKTISAFLRCVTTSTRLCAPATCRLHPLTFPRLVQILIATPFALIFSMRPFPSLVDTFMYIVVVGLIHRTPFRYLSCLPTKHWGIVLTLVFISFYSLCT